MTFWVEVFSNNNKINFTLKTTLTLSSRILDFNKIKINLLQTSNSILWVRNKNSISSLSFSSINSNNNKFSILFRIRGSKSHFNSKSRCKGILKAQIKQTLLLQQNKEMILVLEVQKIFQTTLLQTLTNKSSTFKKEFKVKRVADRKKEEIFFQLKKI